MNILVAGGIGYIGSHTVKQLLTVDGYRLEMVKKSSSGIWRMIPLV
jgi:UDP-glucose 4-epimerase